MGIGVNPYAASAIARVTQLKQVADGRTKAGEYRSSHERFGRNDLPLIGCGVRGCDNAGEFTRYTPAHALASATD